MSDEKIYCKSITVVTGPSVEPLSSADVKAHMGIVGTDQDSIITRNITAARRRVEKLTNRRLITQTLKLFYDSFPADEDIDIPIAPIQSVDSIQYIDMNGATQTLDTSWYTSDITTEPGEVVLNYGYIWPFTQIQRPNAMWLNVTAGYGNAASDVEEGILNAMLIIIEAMMDRPDPNYLRGLERIEDCQLSPYYLKRFV